MKQKKNIIGACFCLCLVICIVAGVIILSENNTQMGKPKSLAQVKAAFQTDIQELKDGKYDNLIYHEFKSSIDNVEAVYNIEIQRDNSYQERTFLENFEIMNAVIDKFFMENFDKSYIVADFHISNEEIVYVDYADIEKICTDEKYNMPQSEFLFGNDTSNGGYMVQIDESLTNVWFSKYGLKDIHPSRLTYEKVYPYISCIRQDDNVTVELEDGEIPLAELEEDVLEYLNSNFPLEYDENIIWGIGDARVINNDGQNGVCFKVRRIYKGIPFEYGSNYSSGMYIDDVASDSGEISYAVSTHPDTMLAFGSINGTVVETNTISEMFSAGDALKLLSEEIGENSIYEVRGIELVYRNCEIPETRVDEVSDILVPKWKIITINQNDDKFTLFYVDVVTGEITERFEYYYE